MTTGIDRANEEFWDELCGSSLARSLGITDRSPASLDRFDQAYMAFYPYLLDRVGLDSLTGKTVLEVGLGYGTLSQKIAAVAGQYTGLDIAAGPVAMVNHRLQASGLAGHAVRGSILDAPLPSESQDVVVSIGCFHHTGDVQRCVDETYRLLRPGGVARVMVYNQFSYRQWLTWPRQTLAAALHERSRSLAASTSQRAMYDANSSGEAAPETVFLSASDLGRMFQRYAHFTCRKENCGELPLKLHRVIPRKLALPTIGRLAGLDLYIEARK